jgi:tRNA nucleotidyltransferase (CCA-adding enzyme)
MIPGSKSIEENVLSRITPSLQEKKQINRIIKELKDCTKKEIKKTKIPITLELVGSTAKDTYVRTSVDIDLFLVFPPETPREVLQEKGLTIGRAILDQQEECFAEHPYVRGIFQGYKTELVPCYKIESASQKLSAVDRTPLHTRYIKKHLKESQKNEVRLFKQFLKGIGCYGAEAEIEGFSGYLCEIMILKYGTFQQLIEHVKNWNFGEKLALKKGAYPDFTTPLTFIDPVDPERNVASALSKEKYDIFVNACKDYTQNPQLTFFFPNKPQPWSLEKIIKGIETKEFIGIKLQKPEIISENLYPQIRKAVRAIRELCEQHEFTILDATYFVESKNIYIILHPKTKTLTKTVIHTGPPVTLKKNADQFIQKWMNHPRTIQKPYEKNKRLYIEIEREYTDIGKLLEEQIRKLSLGKNIDLMIKQEFTVIDKKGFLTDDFRMFWTMYLDPRMPWER